VATAAAAAAAAGLEHGAVLPALVLWTNLVAIWVA
jgi:hypothetical protein